MLATWKKCSSRLKFMDPHKNHKAFVQMAKRLKRTLGHNDCCSVPSPCWVPTSRPLWKTYLCKQSYIAVQKMQWVIYRKKYKNNVLLCSTTKILFHKAMIIWHISEFISFTYNADRQWREFYFFQFWNNVHRNWLAPASRVNLKTIFPIVLELLLLLSPLSSQYAELTHTA